MEQYFPKRIIKPILREIRKRALELFREDANSYKDIITTIMKEFSNRYGILKDRNRAYFTQIINKAASNNEIDLTVFKDRGKARSVLKRRQYFREYKKRRRQEKAMLESGTAPENMENFKKI